MTRRSRLILILAALLAGSAAALTYEIIATRAVREVMRNYYELVAAGDRTDLPEAQRLALARRLCSSRYLAAKGLSLGPEGGIWGLPRTINKNFQAWCEGPNVWICPTNRIGEVYQFVKEDGEWRFDGLVALLRPRGQIIRTTELPVPEGP